MNTVIKNKAKNRNIGRLGEQVAVTYLEKHGYTVIERNYARKWGEVDVIVQKNGIAHFVEVKTVTHETKDALEYAVTHETWRPEELVHRFKLGQIRRMVETWILEHKWHEEIQIDVVAVRMVPRESFASVNFIENVVVP